MRKDGRLLMFKNKKLTSIQINFLYNSLYQLLTIIIPIVTIPYVSRKLGAKGIGIYSYNNSIAYYFIMISMLGLNNYGNRTIAFCRDDKNELSNTFWSIYSLQLITGVISFISYILFTMQFNNNLMAWILLLYVISSILDINWFFFGLEKFKLTVIRNIIIKLLTTICIFIFIDSKNDIYIYGFILAVSTLISQILIWPFVKEYVHFVMPRWKDILKHITPNIILFVPIISMSIYKVMGKTMIGFCTTKQEVGYFENSEKLLQIPLAFVTALGNIMLPRVSNYVYHEKNSLVDQYLYKSIEIVIFLTTSMAFGIMAISNEFVPLFFGEGYLKCVWIINTLLPSTIFISIANVIRTQYLIPNKLDKDYTLSLILGAIICLVLNIFLIPLYKSIGAAIGTLFAEIIVCVSQCHFAKRKINNIKIIFISIPYIISGTIMYLLIFNISFHSLSILQVLVIKVLLGAVIYIFILCLIIFIKKLLNKKL